MCIKYLYIYVSVHVLYITNTITLENTQQPQLFRADVQAEQECKWAIAQTDIARCLRVSSQEQLAQSSSDAIIVRVTWVTVQINRPDAEEQKSEQ